MHTNDYLTYVFIQPSENLNVKVCGKIRPLTETENSKGCKRVVKAQGNSITVDVSNKVIIANFSCL